MSMNTYAEVRKDGKQLEVIQVVPVRKCVELHGKELPSCFWPTFEDIKKHFPEELGYLVVAV